MTKCPVTAYAATSFLTCFALGTALVLVVSGGSIAQAATAGPARRAAPTFADYCHQAKNTVATAPCLDAAKQYASGGVGLAFTLIRKAVRASPNDGNLRMLTGIILQRLGDDARAERELRLARKYGASDQVVLLPLFRSMVARHEENQLLSEFPSPAINARGDVASQILHGRALALKSLHRIDEAAAQMDRSLALRRSPLSLSDRADIALQQENPALADKLIDEALKVAPTYGPALIARLNRLERSGDTARILAFSEHILKMYPNNIESHAARINTFLMLNQDRRAKTELDSVLIRSPRAPLARYYQAVLMSRAKNTRGAFQIILALPPEFVRSHPEFAMQMADIAFDNGNVERGASILGGALAEAPELLDVRLRLVALRMSQNSPQSAMVLLSPVKDFHDPRVKEQLAKIQKAIAKNRDF